MGLFRKWSIQAAFIMASLLYIAGLFLDVMEVDSAQYAAMSMDMAKTNNYLEVTYRGTDYLDKPPLVFWTSSALFKLFGTSNWAFKLPSLLFTLLGLISTYKLGHLLYNKRIGFVACIILLTSQATFLMNNDVRTDTILTGAVIFAVWQIMAFLFYHKRINLIFGFIAIGIAMLSKGPLGIMIPALAVGSYLLGRQNYKDFFRWEWLLGLGIIAIMLAPMTYGLYHQFDMHPEKELLFHHVGGSTLKSNVSGVEFYYWTQSFGRITGENVWNDGSGPFFFVHTFLWSFLPWAVLAFWAIIWRVVHSFRDVFLRRAKQEWLTLGGTLLPFIAMSMSTYKLPHYIWPTFPFVAIITSEFILRVLFEKPRWWRNILTGIQAFLSIILIALSGIILFWFFPGAPWYVIVIWGGLAIFGVYNFFDSEPVNKVILSSVFVALATNSVLTFHFYPSLFPYQSSAVAGRWFKEHKVPVDKGFILDKEAVYTFDFYSRNFYPIVSESNFNPEALNEFWVYAEPERLENIDLSQFELHEEKRLKRFHITALSGDFLNPETREKTLKDRVIYHYVRK